ncbi:hypothetical protein PAJ34TS1_48410 [Paenibacillus azoreducens]|uniref:Uncharacterized protein n=1 Tax=Paenibacillus azoreducens TaxID=116718 RepID=A0A920CTA9_9BACL|nr:hypothetical protein J34TS1_37790 [Paenibacillus azoreducens]
MRIGGFNQKGKKFEVEYSSFRSSKFKTKVYVSKHRAQLSARGGVALRVGGHLTRASAKGKSKSAKVSKYQSTLKSTLKSTKV